MKKSNSLILLGIFALGQLFISCSSEIYLTKRVYRSGYYLSFNNKNKKVNKKINEQIVTINEFYPSSKNEEFNKMTFINNNLLASNENNKIILTPSTTEMPSIILDNNYDNVKKYEQLNKKNKQLNKKDVKKVIKEKVKSLKLSSSPSPAKNEINNNKSKPEVDIVALLLCLFFGGLGIHRFYLGYTWQGIVQLLTAGGCGIWALIDFIRILTGDLQKKK